MNSRPTVSQDNIDKKDFSVESVKKELYKRNHPSLTPIDIEAPRGNSVSDIKIKEKAQCGDARS